MGVTKANSILLRNPKEHIGYSEWIDTGCIVSDACLRCPLPICKHDDRVWYEKYLKLSKHRHAIMELRECLDNGNITEGVIDIAKKHGVTPRTMWRLKKKMEEEEIDYDMIELFYKRVHKRVYGR